MNDSHCLFATQTKLVANRSLTLLVRDARTPTWKQHLAFLDLALGLRTGPSLAS